jgi:hypothetical protein
MKRPSSFLILPACAAALCVHLSACDDQRARQRGIGTLEERSPSGSQGTTGTGADEPAPAAGRDPQAPPPAQDQ